MIPAPPPPESDQIWFADHARRTLRFRPSLKGEPAGWAVIARRDGRRWGWRGWPGMSVSIFDLNANPAALAALFTTMLEDGLRELTAASLPETAAAI